MHVEIGQRLAARDHAGDAFDARQHARQLRLHFEHDLRAPARQQRRVADELDGVAQPLLGMQQDGLAAERIFAEPERLAEAAARRHAAALPAPFVFLEAAAVVAERQQRQPFVVVGVGVVLVERQHLAEIGSVPDAGCRPAARCRDW